MMTWKSQRSKEWFSMKLSLQEEGDESQKIKTIAKSWMIGAGARFLFYPTLLYNVVRHTFEAEFRWWDQIDQFLLLGAVPFPRDVFHLKSIGVQAVVTLNERFETLVPPSMYKDEGISHLVIPTRDYLFAPSFGDIKRAVAFIHEHAQRGEVTYVHCKAGRGRSTTVVLCYLIEYRGMTPLGALNYVQSKRPRVLLATAQWKAVQDFSKIHRHHLESNSHNANASSVPMMTFPLSNSSFLAACTSNPLRVTSEQDEGDCLTEDTPVFVSNLDLEGYDDTKDAWNTVKCRQEIGVAYRLHLLATKNVVAAARMSAAWAKISSSWLGCFDVRTVKQVPSAEAANRNCKTMASNFSGQLSFARIDVAVCHTGLVNC